MDEQAYIPPADPEHGPTSNGFWPVFIIGLSLVLLLSWETWVGVAARQRAQTLQGHPAQVDEHAPEAHGGAGRAGGARRR